MSETSKSSAPQSGKVEEVRDFRIEQLFGSKTRVRLLRLLMENCEQAFFVRELTRRIDAQLNSVRREIQNLIEVGILEVVEGDGEDVEGDDETETKPGKKVNKKFYRTNLGFPFLEEMKSIMKKSAVMMNKPFIDELREKGRVDLVFLTGKFVDNFTISSDMLIVGDISEKALHTAIANFENELGREINFTYMPKEEYLYRAEVKDRFLSSLIDANKVVLINVLDDGLI